MDVGRHAHELMGQRRVLELLACGVALDRALDALCLHIEGLIDGGLCSILLLDETGGRLRRGSAPSLPEAFSEAIDGLSVGPRGGACGTAVYRGDRVVVADAATDPLCAGFRDLARVHGLRACWSVPIRDVGTDRLVGTFAVYHRTVRRPTDDEVALVREAGRLVAVALRNKRAEDAVRQSEARFRSVVEHSQDLVAVLDSNLSRAYVSPSYAHVLGYDVDELMGRSIESIAFPDDLPRLRRVFGALSRRPDAVERFETRVRHRSGAVRWLETVAVNRLADPELRGFVVTSRDVTAHKAAEQRLTCLAFHDPLTGLPNRRLCVDRLRRALAHPDGGGVVVLFLDLDGFKEINDRVGHAGGDALLAALGRRLLRLLPAGGFLARIGGDEFVVVLEGVQGPWESTDLAEALLSTVRRPFAVGGHELTIGAAIGIAAAPADAPTPDGLMHAADAAMYRAKANGGGTWAVYDPLLDGRALARPERTAEPRPAIDARTRGLPELRSAGAAERMRRRRGDDGGPAPASTDLLIEARFGAGMDAMSP